MSNNRYIEFDSTYRNREEWPLPGEFQVLISQTGRKGKRDALDGVSYGMPLSSWSSNDILATGGAQVTGVVDSIGGGNNIAASNNNTTFIITSAAGNLQQQENYYQNLIISDTTINEQRRIISYEYLSTDNGGTNDRARISVESAFGSTFADGDTWTIDDSTDLSNTSEPLFFVPAGRTGTNSYINCILYNETREEFRTITDYDFITHILQINATNPIVGWAATDNYTIRKASPLESSLIAAGTTTTSIVLSAGASTVDDFYNNQFLRIRGATYGNGLVAPQGEARKIVDYDGATLTATIAPPFSNTPTIGNTAEILDFSYDNWNPFIYTGSQVSQQEMICYEIELINLILPNKILASGVGSRIAFYPYIYVELSNISGAGAGARNVIYSNNPNSTRMTFRVPIDDVPNPVISSFVKIDGDGMVQTLKFKPNDNLKFSVRLPNGEVYQTEEREFYSPREPNPEIQISALFSIKKL